MAARMEFPLHESFNLPGLKWVYSLLFFVVYIVLAQLSMMLATAPANVTPLYPPAGLAWGAVLLFGKRALPMVFVSAAIANGLPLLQEQWSFEALLAGIGIGAGEVLSVWLGCIAVLKWRDRGGYLLSVRDVVIFSVVSFFWVVSPSVGVTTLLLLDFVDADHFWHVWRTWWLGDSIGILLLLPVILVLSNLSLSPASPRLDHRSAVAIPLAALMALAICLSELPVWYLLSAVTFYYATRLSHLGIVCVNVIVSSICVWANFLGVSSNGHLSPDLRLILLQMFIAFNTVIVLAFWCSQRKNRELNHKWNLAENKARLDPLTGVLNRRGFEEQAQYFTQHCCDSKRTLLILDIDHFKEINDNYGHDVGDYVLVQFANILRATVRDDDILARIGGEEFAVIVALDVSDASRLAERIRNNIEQASIIRGQQLIRLTASIGVQEFRNEMSIHDWLKIADKHLYFAKQTGRNRVIQSVPELAGG
ncbi:diguanylate cyclase (GGDEF)-like protein [Alteromonadaceae bacterium 2753L.S.0a.02]|nr:diguanylate cyclase (GGDEF)-like protein [Alteromonadaceae bacterium 2753L.S.0a.02]